MNLLTSGVPVCVTCCLKSAELFSVKPDDLRPERYCNDFISLQELKQSFNSLITPITCWGDLLLMSIIYC